MEKENGNPMRPDSIFRICSMTKPITSAAVMLLYEEGRLLLNDPVSKFLPEFKSPKVLVREGAGAPYTIPAKGEITIKHLLTHTSGLTYHWNPDLGPRYRDAGVAHGLLPYDGTIADSVKALAALPLLFHPGERFEPRHRCAGAAGRGCLRAEPGRVLPHPHLSAAAHDRHLLLCAGGKAVPAGDGLYVVRG
jgi:CubicO group peptidase (beta-lactamase class C family)